MKRRRYFSDRIKAVIASSVETKRSLASGQRGAIEDAALAVIGCLKKGGKLLIFGNGGSAADSQHIAAEFVGRFQAERRPLAAISLTTNTSVLTAISNDYGYDISFSRQVEALGRKGDAAMGISTSGNARNVLEAIKTARSMGLVTIGLSGGDGGKIAGACDISIVVPSKVTARIQESHILIGHIICQLAEEEIFRR